MGSLPGMRPQATTRIDLAWWVGAMLVYPCVLLGALQLDNWVTAIVDWTVRGRVLRYAPSALAVLLVFAICALVVGLIARRQHLWVVAIGWTVILIVFSFVVTTSIDRMESALPSVLGQSMIWIGAGIGWYLGLQTGVWARTKIGRASDPT